MTRIDLISGFLGAGKTTWIKRWVGSPLYTTFVDKTFIIENEFGDVSIDTTILEDQRLNVSELSAGCICCSIVGDFTAHLENLIHTHQPDRIIIEPTGVAKLSEVLEACKSMQRKGIALIGQAVTLLDASNAHMYIENFGDFYLDQIKHANQLVLTKTELLLPDELSSLKRLLSHENPLATQLICSDMTDEVVPMAMDLQFDPFPQKDVFQMAPPKHEHHHTAHSTFLSLGFSGNDVVIESTLKHTLIDLFNHPSSIETVVRAKGLFKTDRGGIKFDFAGKNLTFESCTTPKENLCCFIGVQLHLDTIENTFKPLNMNRINLKE